MWPGVHNEHTDSINQVILDQTDATVNWRCVIECNSATTHTQSFISIETTKAVLKSILFPKIVHNICSIFWIKCNEYSVSTVDTDDLVFQHQRLSSHRAFPVVDVLNRWHFRVTDLNPYLNGAYFISNVKHDLVGNCLTLDQSSLSKRTHIKIKLCTIKTFIISQSTRAIWIIMNK